MNNPVYGIQKVLYALEVWITDYLKGFKINVYTHESA